VVVRVVIVVVVVVVVVFVHVVLPPTMNMTTAWGTTTTPPPLVLQTPPIPPPLLLLILCCPCWPPSPPHHKHTDHLLNSPFTAIYGGEDLLTTPKYARYWGDYTQKGASVVILPGVGHGLVLERKAVTLLLERLQSILNQ